MASNILDSATLWRSLLLPTAALGSIALTWGFTVDDALISTRVAHHLWTSGTYAFNPDGPRVDCVTPLGWAWLLSPFARNGVWSGLEAARLIGAVCAVATACVTTLLFNRGQQGFAWQLLLPAAGLWLVNLPLGAWASSGMETPVVMLLCTIATWGSVDGKRWGYACAGVASALRPELIPWSLVLAVGSVLQTLPTMGRTWRASFSLLPVGIVLLPPLLVAFVRLSAFGSPMPLAVLAKPSDAASGFTYVRSALTLLGIPVLLLGVKIWREAAPQLKCVGASLLTHCLAVLAAGGDWMSLFRLFVPLLPTMLWLGASLTTRQSWHVQVVKYALAFVPSALLHVNVGPASSQVVAARYELVRAAAPLLAQSQNVATLDVGWVGAATERPITDLAGVTDVEIAVLPGGHTSKHLPSNLLQRRQVDTLVLLLEPNHPDVAVAEVLAGLTFARTVENRVARLDGAATFRVVSTLPLGGTNQRYVILKRNN